MDRKWLKPIYEPYIIYLLFPLQFLSFISIAYPKYIYISYVEKSVIWKTLIADFSLSILVVIEPSIKLLIDKDLRGVCSAIVDS
jgi:hypothetical protein